ncbi:two pore domain potassium channel family protein [Kribbella sindirgiensis]|uniref:Two pore domain potassium channel family protein n=2 Tax=Kribbella sindirgiensis TaxID=1124744 RepID=A0A4R0IXL2_9ACTN|nr:two pore domain potassium channel family protein [Kribbella sindirgiensis]
MGRDAFAEQYERGAEWPLTVAAVLFLVAYSWPVMEPFMAEGLRHACSVAAVAIWAVFACDFLLRLALARRRLRFLREHVVDLLVLALPLLRPLRVLRVVTALGRLNRRAASSLRGRAIVYVIGGVGLLGFTAAVAVLDAERSQPSANIKNFGDAAWWAVTTITTVGYGDRFPTTGAGRIAGVGLMLGGIALLGVVTAALASWFVEHVARQERDEADLREQVSALVEEVRALRAELGRSPSELESNEPGR